MKYVPPRMYGPVYEFLGNLASGLYEPLGIYNIKPDYVRKLHAQMHDAKVIQIGVPEWAADEGGALTQFVYDTITEGIFWPPFDNFFLEWEDSPLDKPDRSNHLYAAALCIVLVRRGELTGMGEARIGEKVAPGEWARDKKPTIMEIFGFSRLKNSETAMMSDSSMIISAKFSDQRAIRGQELPKDNFLARNIFKSEFVNAQFDRDAGVTMSNVCYAIGLMASKGPVATTHIPEQRIVERRARENRTPWVSYQTLMLPGRSGIGTGGGKIEGRASPRLHWRRGHVRRRGDKVYTVVPHLVGASDMGRVISNYVVTKE